MKIVKTAPGALKILWKENLFKKKRKFEEIKAELGKRGYNFTDCNLGMALKDAKFLTRSGKKGDYSYVQKHPYVQEDEDESE